MAPVADVVDLDAEGDRIVTIKEDGEEKQLPLREALSGYLRQSKFTRSMQDVAAQRAEQQNASTEAAASDVAQKLYNEMSADPIGVSKMVLAEAGIRVGKTPVVGSAVDDWGDPVESEGDPTTSRLAALEQQLQQERAARQLESKRSAIRQEAIELSARYPGVDLKVVADHLRTGGHPNLHAAYRDLMFDSVAVVSPQSRAVSETQVAATKKVARRGAARPKGSAKTTASTRDPDDVRGQVLDIVRQSMETVSKRTGEPLDWNARSM